MRITVHCEGRTEWGLRDLIAAAVGISECGIRIKPYDGIGALLHDIPRKVEIDARGGTQYIFCLVDCYHYPLPQIKQSLSIDSRVTLIKEDILSRIATPLRGILRPHVVVQEVEAWILADEDILRQRLKIPSLPAWPKPEEVDDMKPPSRVLNELFRTRSRKKRSYSKIRDGVELLRRIDHRKVMAKCPSFRDFIEALRQCCSARIS